MGRELIAAMTYGLRTRVRVRPLSPFKAPLKLAKALPHHTGGRLQLFRSDIAPIC